METTKVLDLSIARTIPVKMDCNLLCWFLVFFHFCVGIDYQTSLIVQKLKVFAAFDEEMKLEKLCDCKAFCLITQCVAFAFSTTTSMCRITKSTKPLALTTSNEWNTVLKLGGNLLIYSV